ncbi:MAG: head GIN domain-containing protein [Ferruginibacter sp.]
MKKLLLSLAGFFALAVFAQDNQVNDPNATPRAVTAGFNAIHVSSGIDLYISPGNTESMAVSANDPIYLERLKTEVVSGTLKIYFDNTGMSGKTGYKNLKVYVSFKTLEKLVASAGSEVHVIGTIETEKLNLQVSSGADFKGTVHAKTLLASVSSGAAINISGKADQLTVDVSSGAEFNGYGFAADICDAKARSGASVQVTINKELTANAGSGADIRYKGTALIRDKKVRGGGSVKKS